MGFAVRLDPLPLLRYIPKMRDHETAEAALLDAILASLGRIEDLLETLVSAVQDNSASDPWPALLPGETKPGGPA